MGRLQQPIADNTSQESYEEPDEIDKFLAEEALKILETNDKWFTHNDVMKELGPEFYEKYKI